jgi:hypothetical protein
MNIKGLRLFAVTPFWFVGLYGTLMGHL